MEENIEEIQSVPEEDLDPEFYGEGMPQTSEEDLLEAQNFSGSDPKGIGGIYGLFDKIISDKDNFAKIANLTKEELGDVGSSVRHSLFCHQIGNTFGHKEYGKFFREMAKNTADTSLGAGGFLIKSIITSKKDVTRESKSSVTGFEDQPRKSKWKMFGRK